MKNFTKVYMSKGTKLTTNCISFSTNTNQSTTFGVLVVLEHYFVLVLVEHYFVFWCIGATHKYGLQPMYNFLIIWLPLVCWAKVQVDVVCCSMGNWSFGDILHFVLHIWCLNISPENLLNSG